MAGSLAGKRALVTGAAGGIGAAVARRLAADGAHVTAMDSVPADSCLIGDVTDPGDVAAAVRAAGELDICVANAGVSLMEPLVDGSVESWSRVLRVNVVGVLLCFRAAARSMIEQGRGGRLLATASVAGLRGEADASAYSASKAGVIGLIRALAVELAPFSITVNGVAPGQIETAMQRRDLETVARGRGVHAAHLLEEHLRHRVPACRLGTADEVAAALAFLASAEASYITGAILTVDGGEAAG